MALIGTDRRTSRLGRVHQDGHDFLVSVDPLPWPPSAALLGEHTRGTPSREHSRNGTGEIEDSLGSRRTTREITREIASAAWSTGGWTYRSNLSTHRFLASSGEVGGPAGGSFFSSAKAHIVGANTSARAAAGVPSTQRWGVRFPRFSAGWAAWAARDAPTEPSLEAARVRFPKKDSEGQVAKAVLDTPKEGISKLDELKAKLRAAADARQHPREAKGLG